MHVDLWSPGLNEDESEKGYLMKSMCNINQFIISSLTVDISAAHLAQIFMVDLVLTFGVCSAVVVDGGSSFKGVFTAMRKYLYLTY